MNSIIKRIAFIIIFFFVIAAVIPALDFWRYPEIADKNNLFAGVFAASLAFSIINLGEIDFKVYFPEFYLDYVLPVGLPFSFGVSVKPLTPNNFGLGIRPAYHINTNIPNLNFYVMYTLNFETPGEFGVIEFGGRLGFRYLLFNIICLNVETGYRLRSLHFGLAIKLN